MGSFAVGPEGFSPSSVLIIHYAGRFVKHFFLRGTRIDKTCNLCYNDRVIKGKKAIA